MGSKGPQFNTNAQVGKENTQQAVANQTNRTISTGARSTITTVDNNQKVSADVVEKVIVNEGVPTVWVAGLALVGLLGWVLPTPSQMGSSFLNLFRRKRMVTNKMSVQ
ncbi:MAG: hypothetical protein COA78_20240 [Blastopirellula sp.]|nr:MAG: hypothetical protein COA78_20240 [Blastopirellula sp.]